jgi:hypothetical protein
MGKMPQNSSAWKCPAETDKIDSIRNGRCDMKQTMLSQLMKVCLLRAATRVARRCT